MFKNTCDNKRYYTFNYYLRNKFNNKVIKINNIPFPIPIITIIDDIVYPKQNPLYSTIPNTIGIPITVEPINHILIASFKFSINEFFKSFPLSIE